MGLAVSTGLYSRPRENKKPNFQYQHKKKSHNIINLMKKNAIGK